MSGWKESSLVIAIDREIDLVNLFTLNTGLDATRYNLYTLDRKYLGLVGSRPESISHKRELQKLIWNTLYSTRLSLRDSIRTALQPIKFYLNKRESDNEFWKSLPSRLDLGEHRGVNSSPPVLQIISSQLKEYTYYNIVHIAACGLYCTNNLDIPNFRYVYAAFQQGYSTPEGLALECVFSSWCCLEEMRYSLVKDATQEYAPLRFDLYASRVSDSDLIVAYLQILFALHVAHKEYGYNHNALTENSVLVQRLDRTVRIRYDTAWGSIYIDTRDIVVLNSSSRSRFVHQGVSYGPYDKESYELGIQNVDNPSRDVYDAYMLLPVKLRGQLRFPISRKSEISYLDAIDMVLSGHVDIPDVKVPERNLGVSLDLDDYLTTKITPFAYYVLDGVPDTQISQELGASLDYWMEELQVAVKATTRGSDLSRILDIQARVHKYIEAYRYLGGDKIPDTTQVDKAVSRLIDTYNDLTFWIRHPPIDVHTIGLETPMYVIPETTEIQSLGVDVMRIIAMNSDYVTMVKLCAIMPEICDSDLVMRKRKSLAPVDMLIKLSVYYIVSVYTEFFRIDIHRDVLSVLSLDNRKNRQLQVPGVVNDRIRQEKVAMEYVLGLDIRKIEIGRNQAGTDRYL